MEFRQSKPVVVVPYRDSWPNEFRLIASQLNELLGDSVIRIDHIGSTAVPELAAKDIIDIQITLADIDNADDFIQKMQSAGYRKRGDIKYDEMAGCDPSALKQLRKRYFREAEGQRRVHIHVRQEGYLNQRYPLVFRDYLIAHAAVRKRYEMIKYRLAALFPEQVGGYLHIKDPLMDIIYEAAQNWALRVDWKPQ